MEENNNSIPEMDLKKYDDKKPIVPQTTTEQQKELDKTKKELEKLKNHIIKKYPFTQSLSILPPQSIPAFVDEGEVPKETEKYIQLYMIVPEDEYKNIPKITKDLIPQLEKLKQKVWLQIKTPVDVWDVCLDSKFELSSAIFLSFPLHDTGFLSSLRLAEIHKSLVLQKFEKYVVSYVVAGSLVRGDTTKESDVDVFLVINDTDVKRMPRLELKERLRSMIHQMIPEAAAMAGVKKNLLNVQPYLLTDFWESVKDAHPVMFTFIRDGIPIHDKGTFMPWKALLKMGKLKPSPEAIDMFMSMGDKTVERAKRMLLDIVIHEIYWGIVSPSQALMMLNGLPPPSPKHLVQEFKKAFYDKEKMIEKKYIDILDRVVSTYKGYEHEKVKEIKGEEVDKFIRDVESYLKRLKDLREQIEKNAQEKTIEDTYKETFNLVKAVLGKVSQTNIVSEFEKKMVKTGKFAVQHQKILENIISARKDFKKGKLNSRKVDRARKDATILINALIEYSQRCELAVLERGRIVIEYKEEGKPSVAELMIFEGGAFLFMKNKIKKLTTKIEDSTMEEVSKTLEGQKKNKKFKISPKVFELLESQLGSYELLL
jgi:predicted nucleotidyltransferase/uncharacterized protein (UPF0332 family)